MSFDNARQGLVVAWLVRVPTIAKALTDASMARAGAEPPLDSFRRLAKYRIMTQVFRALSDPTRRRVLQLLRAGPMSAGELSDQFDVSKPTMSAHFAVLKEADLVHAEKAGKSVIYHLKLSVLEEALLGFIDSFGLGAEAPAPKGETAR
jgi:DNA-binding transcriptional ArsR family regulator